MTQPLLSFDYHYGNEADQYTFYRLPKILFTDDRYKNVSDRAKILYGLMLDRMGLSVKNSWIDDTNRVYIFFTLEDVQEYMNCKQDKAVKLLAELDSIKGVGLIERVRQGQGRPTKIYVKKFINTAEVLTSENPKSALPKNRNQDFGKTETNNTEVNDTENQSVCQVDMPQKKTDRMDSITDYRDLIMDNVDYDILADRYGQERMNQTGSLYMTDVAEVKELLQNIWKAQKKLLSYQRFSK